jgi:hypothetical protein
MFQPKGKNSESMKTVEVELSEDFLTGKLFSDIVTKDLVNDRVNQKLFNYFAAPKVGGSCMQNNCSKMWCKMLKSDLTSAEESTSETF